MNIHRAPVWIEEPNGTFMSPKAQSLMTFPGWSYNARFLCLLNGNKAFEIDTFPLHKPPMVFIPTDAPPWAEDCIRHHFDRNARLIPENNTTTAS